MKRSLSNCRLPAIVTIVVLTLSGFARAQSVEMATRSRTVTVTEQPADVQTTRRVLVHSTSLLVRGAVVEDKLLKNSDFKRLGFVITRDLSDADLVLELRHDLLTMYVFTVVDAKTLTVIAGGKLSSLGGTVAGKVAKRFVKEMNAAKSP